jgi:hypothetical protein
VGACVNEGAGVTDCAGYLGGISSDNMVADGDCTGLAVGGKGTNVKEACAIGDLYSVGEILLTALALGVDACFPPHVTRNKLINASRKRRMFFLGMGEKQQAKGLVEFQYSTFP